PSGPHAAHAPPILAAHRRRPPLRRPSARFPESLVLADLHLLDDQDAGGNVRALLRSGRARDAPAVDLDGRVPDAGRRRALIPTADHVALLRGRRLAILDRVRGELLI